MKKTTQKRVSVLTLVIGIALPLFLILAGGGGMLWAKLRS